MTRRDTHTPNDGHLERELEAALGGASSGAADDLAPRDAGEAMGSAFGSFRQTRRRRLTAVSAVVLLVGLGGLFYARTQPTSPTAVDKTDPVAYANYLYKRIVPKEGDSNYWDRELLKRDAEARAEYVAALDHPNTIVRRTALFGLDASGVPIPDQSLRTLLIEHREDLSTPLLVASGGSMRRAVTEAIERSRLATLQRVLGTMWTQASRGELEIAPDVITPFLSHETAGVRMTALNTLSFLPSYRPDAEIERLMRADPDRTVRLAATDVMSKRGGARGIARIYALLRNLKYPEDERVLLYNVRETAGFDAFALERLDAPDVSLQVKLQYALHLARAGDGAPADKLMRRAFAGSDANEVLSALTVCTTLKRDDLRPIVVAAWERLAPEERSHVSRSLAIWDLNSGERHRMLSGVKLARVLGRMQMSFALKRHVDAGDPSVRAAVRTLLAEWKKP